MKALVVFSFLLSPLLFASIGNKKVTPLVDQLHVVRKKLLHTEKELLESVHLQKKAQAQVQKIKLLIELQKEESKLGKKRLQELSSTISELENRRFELNEKIRASQKKIRKFLMVMNESLGSEISTQDEIMGPKRQVLARLVENGLKEITIFRVDLDDADELEERIQEEKQHLAYLMQDLNEQETLLEFNRQLQTDIFQKKHEQRLAQFESYRKLKETESQVEELIGQFNARKELEKVEEAERTALRSTQRGAFARLKGRLMFPVPNGQVVSGFGKVFDSKSGLHIFKKGIDITTGKEMPVMAVSDGKVAYSGELQGYGKVAIIDHGQQYYSLLANLGHLTKKNGDTVSTGDTIGRTDDLGTPVYFEIRARNVAVNPLQWLAN